VEEKFRSIQMADGAVFVRSTSLTTFYVTIWNKKMASLSEEADFIAEVREHTKGYAKYVTIPVAVVRLLELVAGDYVKVKLEVVKRPPRRPRDA